jgi:hypothetical protein
MKKIGRLMRTRIQHLTKKEINSIFSLNGFGYAQSALMKIGLRKKAISWFR